MRTVFLCVITQRVVVITYRRFGTTCRSHLQGWRIQKMLLDSWTRKGSVLIYFAAEAWNHAFSINVDLILTVVVLQLPWSANLLQPTPPARWRFWKGGGSAVCWYSTLSVQLLLTQVCWWPHKGPLRVIFPNSDLRSPCKDDSDETK